MNKNWELLAKIGLGLVGYLAIDEIIDTLWRQEQLNTARMFRNESDKPMLNISCGKTNFGDINADVVPQNVPNFVLYTPDTKLPFKDKNFSVAFSSHTAEHVKNPIEFIRELYRVADRVIIAVPFLFSRQFLNPTHRWIMLDQTGVNYIPSPFYSVEIVKLANENNLWRSNFWVK